MSIKTILRLWQNSGKWSKPTVVQKMMGEMIGFNARLEKENLGRERLQTKPQQTPHHKASQILSKLIFLVLSSDLTILEQVPETSTLTHSLSIRKALSLEEPTMEKYTYGKSTLELSDPRK
jgi:hypothetical protein